jgi:hypothetical protein
VLHLGEGGRRDLARLTPSHRTAHHCCELGSRQGFATGIWGFPGLVKTGMDRDTWVKTVLQFYPREDGIWSLFYSFYSIFFSQDGLAFKIIAGKDYC